MKLWCSHYELIPLQALNSRSKAKPLRGALLKVEFRDGQVGYSDLCPHPELGDFSLERQLHLLKEGEPSEQARQSLIMAEIDAEARARNVSLFENLSLPKTHYLAGAMLGTDISILEKVKSLGYGHIKFKVGLDPAKEIKLLNQFADSCEDLLFRLDFNEVLTNQEYADWVVDLSSRAKSSIDFVEDPFPFALPAWSQSRDLPLAVDRAAKEYAQDASSGLIVIVKPAIQSSSNFKGLENHRLIYTNYMDHPLGEVSAIYCACVYLKGLSHLRPTYGLRTFHLFQSNTYSSLLQNEGPNLVVPEGTGFGFNELLESEEWMPLN